jgi:hypothetical protein
MVAGACARSRAVIALMLLQKTKLETLKIDRANDCMGLRYGLRNTLTEQMARST